MLSKASVWLMFERIELYENPLDDLQAKLFFESNPKKAIFLLHGIINYIMIIMEYLFAFQFVFRERECATA